MSTSIRIALRTSGSLSGGSIEPDTSRRKTRFRRAGSSSDRLAAANADQRETMVRVPRAGREFGGHRERIVAVRLRIIEAEVVDQLLDAHGARGRQRPVGQEPADVRIGGGIDVDRERRQRIVRDATQAALVDVVVGLGVEVAPNTISGSGHAVRETVDNTANDAGGNATRNAGPKSCGLRLLTRRFGRYRDSFLRVRRQPSAA